LANYLFFKGIKLTTIFPLSWQRCNTLSFTDV